MSYENESGLVGIDDELPPPNTEIARVEADANARQKYMMAAMAELALRRPRKVEECFMKMKLLAQRPSMAEVAIYQFPRGGKKVTGVSVKAARPLATAWGNMQIGQQIIGRSAEEMHIMGFAWDIENNVFFFGEDKFKMVHQRKDDDGIARWVEVDERDGRELANRRGAILTRNAMLHALPADFIDDFRAEVGVTKRKLAEGQMKANPQETIKKLLVSFLEIGVSRELIEKRINKKVEAIDALDVVELREIYQGIASGEVRVAAQFDVRPKPEPVTTVSHIDIEKAQAVEGQDPPGGKPIDVAAPEEKPKNMKRDGGGPRQ